MQIELHRIVANMYRGIGNFDEARDHLYQALELAESEGGYDPHGEKYADLLVDLAGQVNWAEAGVPFDQETLASFARRALAIYHELGIETQATADAYCWLAKSLNNIGGHAASPHRCRCGEDVPNASKAV